MAKGAWPGGLVLIAAMLACTPLQKHAVLDFVFDGVPPYLTPEERAIQIQEAALRQAEPKIEGRKGRKVRIRKLARFTHGPFAANECTRCHDLTTASGFRKMSGGGGGIGSGADLAEAGRLRMPVQELCVQCHTDLANDAPANDGLWLHGPVASGWCVLCHQPHSAYYPYLLSLEPLARLCTSCHLREDLVQTAEHRPLQVEDGFPDPPTTDPDGNDEEEAAASSAPFVQVVRDCTRCHNPHLGPDRLILRPRHEWDVPEELDVRRASLDVRDEGEL